MALTIQQAEGNEVTLLKLNNQYKKPRGFILLLRHPKTGRLLRKTDFVTLDNNISICDCDFDFSKKGVLTAIRDRVCTIWKSCTQNNEEKRIIYVAAAGVNYTLLNIIEKNVPNSKVIFILLEDGAGAYVSDLKTYIGTFSINNYYDYARFLKGLCISAYNELLKKILCFHGRVIDNRLFLKKENNFIRNQEIASCYDALYKRKSSLLSEGIINEFSASVVINTQCLKENGITDGKMDYCLYERLIKILKERGIKVVIKTHPRELNPKKYERLGCSVFCERKYSQESIIAATRIKPACIVSIYSSTLLNVNGIFGIPVISLANVFMQEYKIGRELKDDLLNFIDDYRSIIEFPCSMDDAVDRICSKVSNCETNKK